MHVLASGGLKARLSDVGRRLSVNAPMLSEANRLKRFRASNTVTMAIATYATAWHEREPSL